MPLTDFQRELLASLAKSPTCERYLAGGAAMHFAPNSTRFSDDLDFFHDSEARVASAFASDRETLLQAGYEIQIELSLPGFVRAVVRRSSDATRVDWAHDSAWRFMPLVRDELGGLLLDPVDLAVNKVLALAGRDEVRDYIDILFVHERVLPLAALSWAAVGKDPGFTPLSLLELLKRRGRNRPEDFARLHLAGTFDLPRAKTVWLDASPAPSRSLVNGRRRSMAVSTTRGARRVSWSRSRAPDWPRKGSYRTMASPARCSRGSRTRDSSRVIAVPYPSSYRRRLIHGGGLKPHSAPRGARRRLPR